MTKNKYEYLEPVQIKGKNPAKHHKNYDILMVIRRTYLLKGATKKEAELFAKNNPRKDEEVISSYVSEYNHKRAKEIEDALARERIQERVKE